MDTPPYPTWYFAPSAGGILYGYNNAGTEHFKQDPIGKLVRETVQNSLDAHEDGLPPVIVDISECDIASELIGVTTLKRHLEKSLEQTKATGQADGQRDYRRALTLLRQATIPCLSIVDRNTTGLQGRKWDSLIYEEGIPEKDGIGSPGGSFGIGKNAPYNVAAIHTVIYSTRYTKGRQGRTERMTARSQLVSHQSPHNELMLQHIGFYAGEGNQPIAGPDIPDPFRLSEAGTGLWIVGFDPENAQWHHAAIRTTLDSFFYAIHNRNLTVNIRTKRENTVTICHDTIDGLLEQQKGSSRTVHYYKAIRKEPSGATKPAGYIGPLEVHINNEKGAPRRVAYVNRIGMLITDTRERRRSNPFYPGSGQGGWPDFAVVITAREDATDRQIRKMENPAHDVITVERLPSSDREAAREHLNDVSAQIRDAIERSIRDRDEADISNLTELAEIFPDLDPTVPGNRELQTHTVTPKPQPHQITTLGEESDQEEESDGHQDEGNENGNTNREGTGQGSGSSQPNKGAQDNENGSSQTNDRLKRSAIQGMVIMRTGTNELSIALSPSTQAGRKISFSIEPSGEIHWLEHRLPIKAIKRVEPKEAKVEHSNGIITVTVTKRQNVPIIITLEAEQDETYTGYSFSERQAPENTLSTEERIAKIQILRNEGLNQTKIGEQLGISRQRVSQLAAKHLPKGNKTSESP